MRPSEQNEVAIEEFMEGETRAAEWTALRKALQDRLCDAVNARDALPIGSPERAAQDERVQELRAQVTALAEEEAVSQFVEDSVRASLTRPARPGGLPDEFDFDDDEGY